AGARELTGAGTGGRGRAALALAATRLGALEPAPRGDDPCDDRRGCGAAPLGPPARALSPVVRHHLRPAPADSLRDRRPVAAVGGPALRLGPALGHRRAALAHPSARLRAAVPGGGPLPRGARPAPPPGEPAHRVLSLGGAGRRAGWRLQRPGRAPRLHVGGGVSAGRGRRRAPDPLV